MSTSDLPDRPHRMWTSAEFRNVFYNQYVVVLGDSIQRAIYKDFVKLHQSEEMLTTSNLKGKGENSFMGDDLLRGSRLTNGKEYEEIRYFFLTKIYSDYVESVVFTDLKRNPPDILIVNSCVWDITRYGPEAISEYKTSLERFFTRLCHDRVVPETTEIIWLSTLPLGAEIKGGFIVNTVQFMDVSRLRLDILEANRWVAENVAPFYDVNVLDLHYMLRHYQTWREADGIHWNGYAHRYITSAICEFIEYLNIRALRERKEVFSEGTSFAQPLLPPIVLSRHQDQHGAENTGGPMRTRRIVRDASEPYYPANRNATFTRVDAVAQNSNLLHRHGSFENIRSFGLSTSHLPVQHFSADHRSTFADSFNSFQDRPISRPFWANGNFAQYPR